MVTDSSQSDHGMENYLLWKQGHNHCLFIQVNFIVEYFIHNYDEIVDNELLI